MDMLTGPALPGLLIGAFFVLSLGGALIHKVVRRNT